MNVLLFGATGMVGRGVLRECLLAPDVQSVTTIGRTPTGAQNPKLREVVHRDLTQFGAIEAELAGLDACFFCLGIASAGMSEADYQRITHDIAVAAAETLARLNPGMTFVFVSAAGADSSEKGRIMWARIKGKAENAVLRMPFHAAYVFRPGIIQPLHGIQSKTALYRIVYQVGGVLFPLLRKLFPAHVLTTEEIGRAMLNAVRHGAPKRVLESRDIRALAGTGASGRA